MAVIATLPDGREQIGSGFLVESRLVLTAGHCTRDKKTGAAPTELRVIGASDGAAATVDDVVTAPELDMAVLRLTHAPREAGVPTPVYARVDRSHSGVLRDCTAIGFPLFQREPSHSARHTAELHGTIYQTDEAETGRLLMREQLLSHLEPPEPGDDGQREPADPVWGGLSGALVFHAGRAIGVIVEHHPRQGPSAVQLVAFDTLRKHAETDRDAQRVADALQLPPVEQLAMAATEPVEPLLGLVDVINDTSDDLPRVRDLDPYRLGTTSSDYGTRDTYGEHDPYVPRTRDEVDTRLRAALEPSRFVLLVGPAKVGKTRTAFEAIHATWQDARLAAPTPQQLAKLTEHTGLRGSSDPLVVWLDELDRFLTTTEPLTPAMLTMLLARPGPTVVVATLRQEARLRLREATGELTRDSQELLNSALTIELRSTAQDSDEQAAAQAAYPNQPLDGVGLAERLGYAPELLTIYNDSETGNPVLHTVVRAAIDWARTGLSRPIPEKDLLEIADSVLAEELPARQVSRKKITAAIKKARTPLGSGTSAALLLTVSLSKPSAGAPALGYRAYDYLVAADDGQTGPPRPVPEQAWQEALARADSNESFAVGMAANQRGNHPISIRAVERTARAGTPRAMVALGMLLADQEPPDLDGARHWYEEGAEAGYIDAMLALGMLLADQEPPDLDGARHWWEKAARAGDTDAMVILGIVLADQEPPDLDGARHWLEEAARTGHTNAMVILGVLLAARWEPPDLDGARHWYEEAARAGHVDSMVNLGFLLADQEPPDLDGARHWWEEAARAGDTDAMANLGILLEDLDPPDLDGARHWYEEAAEAGHTGAILRLGRLLAARWEEAARAGHTDAMVALGCVLAVKGDMARARAFLVQAEQAEHPGASDYAAALDDNGARAALRERAEDGDTDALNFLGILEWRVGDLDAAHAAWKKSHDAHNTVARILLRMTG